MYHLIQPFYYWVFYLREMKASIHTRSVHKWSQQLYWSQLNPGSSSNRQHVNGETHSDTPTQWTRTQNKSKRMPHHTDESHKSNGKWKKIDHERVATVWFHLRKIQKMQTNWLWPKADQWFAWGQEQGMWRCSQEGRTPTAQTWATAVPLHRRAPGGGKDTLCSGWDSLGAPKIAEDGHLFIIQGVEN